MKTSFTVSVTQKLSDPCFLPYEMNYDNNWSVVHPILNISKDQLRAIPKELGKKFNYNYIFGTPGSPFKNNTIDVELSNFPGKHAKTSSEFFKEICKELENISGKKVTYKIKYARGYYGDEPEIRFNPDPETGRDWRGRVREDFEYTQVVLHLIFNDK